MLLLKKFPHKQLIQIKVCVHTFGGSSETTGLESFLAVPKICSRTQLPARHCWLLLVAVSSSPFSVGHITSRLRTQTMQFKSLPKYHSNQYLLSFRKEVHNNGNLSKTFGAKSPNPLLPKNTFSQTPDLKTPM